MDEAGVAQAVMCGWPWADPVLCREHNDYLAAIGERERRAAGLVGHRLPGASEAARQKRSAVWRLARRGSAN